MNEEEYMTGPIPEHDKGAIETLRSLPALLMRGMFKGEEVTFLCVARDGAGRVLDGPAENGDTCIYPFAVLHGLTEEEVEHCLDPCGMATTDDSCGETA